MTTTPWIKAVPLALGAAVMLAACGGGGGGNMPQESLDAVQSRAMEPPQAAAHGADVSDLARDLTQPGAGLDRSKLARFKEVARSLRRKPGEPGIAEASQVSLTYISAGNWFRRVISSSAEQATFDSEGLRRFSDRRQRASNGVVAHWSVGGEPSRQSDFHFNGTAWVQCQLQEAGVSTAFDASGTSQYNYCDGLDVGAGQRTEQDVGGQSMLTVYRTMRAAGATNVLILNDEAVLGAATFPQGATLVTQTNTPSATAFAYYPGLGNAVRNPIAAVAAGDATVCPTITGATPLHTYTSYADTLESMVQTHGGTPCIYPPGTPYPGGPFSGPRNEWWTQATVGLGILNNQFVPDGYYTANMPLRAAFSGATVTYYKCRQRFDGAVRNCDAIGTGTHTIETMGEGRVMRLANQPALILSLPYEPTFVERGGKVYQGYKNRPVSTTTARLDLAGLNALATQLGLPAIDPEVPQQTTRASFAGDWVLAAQGALDTGETLTVRMSPDLASVTCVEDWTNVGMACTLENLDDGGNFRLVTSNDIILGSFRLVEGTASGTLNPPPGSTAPVETMEGRRR